MPGLKAGTVSSGSGAGSTSAAEPMADSPNQELESFEISPLMLFPETSGWFSVYLKVDDRLVLYAKGPDGFTNEHRHRLHDFGVDKVHILTAQKRNYQRYVEDNLGPILDNEKVPLKERAEVFYSASLSLIQETFEEKLPGSIQSDHFQRIKDLVQGSLSFLRKGGSLKALTGLINHDYYTYNHCVNVFTIAAALLETYGYKRREMIDFGLGAILHDLGKSLIPKEIINKPGKLDADEWEVMKTHTTIGGLIIGDHSSELLQTARMIALSHHERWDGTGYPWGKKGEEIPLAARIVTVADVFDALTTVRPYKPAWDADKAVKEIVAGRDKAFDPAVVDAFLALHEKGVLDDIRAKYPAE